MSELRKAKQHLSDLRKYLVNKNAISKRLQFGLEYDPGLDWDNIDNPRNFCAVTPKNIIILCSRFIESPPPEARIGILLHEISHIVANAFGGDESEVDCDVWIKENVPEAGYEYRDIDYKRDGVDVTAKGLQVVSKKFVRMLRDA